MLRLLLHVQLLHSELQHSKLLLNKPLLKLNSLLTISPLIR
jgi:hypothetical protein